MTPPTPPAPSSPPVVPGAVHRVVVGERDGHARGLASLGRRPLRIPNALPGETLDVRLDHVGRHLAAQGASGITTRSRWSTSTSATTPSAPAWITSQLAQPYKNAVVRPNALSR